MKSLFFLTTLLGISLCTADTKGIKSANIKGADVSLMNNHDPASELENFTLLPGYQANLFASDPMLANPVHMHWDARGRLWVACSWTYPQLKPGDVANDKIIILEDTDNDGKADKSTVFADGLYLPTGIEIANGGCYVGQSPDVFFLKDTDGDDVADVKELVLTGFGIEDSHHSISAWRRGPGGWIYFQEGIFLHAQVETQHGVLRNFNGGVYQFNPRTQELRMFCTGTGGNPWGHVFDRWGQSFMVNNPKIMYLSPVSGNSGESMQVKPLISTEKQCGGDFASGSHIGDDLRGQLMSGRFKSRAVIRYEFVEDGAGFKAKVLKPLITSKHPNFRPVDVKMGPDGAVYVADWYNSIINHAQHDFRDPRRDHTHGRIWRITHKERPLVEKPDLVDRDLLTLVDELRSSEDWTRHQAKNVLSERDPDEVLKALEAWVAQLDPTLPDYDHHLVEAMWACQNVERSSEKILTMVLSAKDGHARSAGARILRYWHQDLSDPNAMIATAAADPFPRTRMEAVLSAGFIPKAEAITAALHVTDHPGDSTLDKALPQTTKALEKYWRPAMEAGTLKFAKESHKAFLESKAGIGFDRSFDAFLKNSSPTPEETAEMKTQFTAVATSREIHKALTTLIDQKSPPNDEVSIALLEALKSKAGTKTSRKIRRSFGALKRLLDHPNPTVACLAIENFGDWKVAKVNPQLLALLKSNPQPMEVRQSAAIALAKLGQNFKDLKSLSESPDVSTRYAAIPGLIQSDLTEGVKSAVNLLTADPGKVDPVPVLQSLLKVRRGAKSLAAELKGKPLHPTVLARVSEFHRTTGQLPKSIAPYFQSAQASGSLSAKLLAENQDQLAADAIKLGDPHRGEAIYRRKELACASCHAIGPAGPNIGPNLIAVGAAASPSYMVESILKPNATIAEHYENRYFTLTDGSVQMGVITFKNEKEIVIRDSAQQGKEVRIPLTKVQREQAMPSLMPAGLADQLKSRQEFLDLTHFLSVLGRPGDFASNESPLLRKWRITGSTEERKLQDLTGWTPAYSMVNGELPSIDLTPLGNYVYAKSIVDILSPGPITLAINNPTGLRLWKDGAEVKNLTTPIKFEKGNATLTFGIDRAKRPDIGLKVELKSPPNSPAKFQPVGGQ